MSLLQAIRRNAAFRARQPAFFEGDVVHDWRTFHDRVRCLAGSFSAIGVRPGDRVGVLALNSRAYLEVQFAIWWIGGAIVPMNTRWSIAENAYVVSDGELRFLCVDRHFYTDGEALQGNAAGVTLVGMDEAAPPGLPTIEQLIQRGEIAPDIEPARDALAGVYYTGGTTGVPKGVMLSQHALWINAMSVAQLLGVSAEDRVLHAAPIFHMAGIIMAHCGVLNGSAHVFMPRFVASELIDNVERFGITKMLLVPTMIQMMLEAAEYTPTRLATLEALSFGGAPIPAPILARLKEELPKVALFHTYGQTEMGPAISCLESRWQYAGSPKGLSVGTPFNAVEVKVVDPEGAPVAAGVPGEIWARGPGQMQGYLNKPEETSRAITREGWVRTGDVAYQDEDGYLYICDRAKDMIITGGENVFSGEVENVILTHPAVKEAAVIAVPHQTYGEAVHAVLVLHEGATVEFEDLRAHCKAKIAAYKCPRSMETRGSMPLSAAGKVLKRELRAPHWQKPS